MQCSQNVDEGNGPGNHPSGLLAARKTSATLSTDIYVGQCNAYSRSSQVKPHLGSLGVVCMNIHEMRNRNYVSYKVAIHENKREVALDPNNGQMGLW